MPNNYFQFKEFTVQQDKCAMKVCTDACVFGAYLASTFNHSNTNTGRILDIGTGTGLLSLMLAQQTNCPIDAADIDEGAYLQAKENFLASPWKERLTAVHIDVLTFKPRDQYDLIVSNPPFFENDLRSANQQKNAARHDTSLTLQQLLNAADRFLSGKGHIAVLLPYHRMDYFEKEAAGLSFFAKRKLLLKQSTRHNYFRTILIFSREPGNCITTELGIKNEEGKYSLGFIELLKDYYLNI